MKARRPDLPTRSALGSPSLRGAGATPLSRTARRLALAACAAIAVTACKPYVQGNGVYLEETRSPLPDFVGVDLESGIDATVTVGPAQSVVVSGDANVVKWITTDVHTDTVRGAPLRVLHVFVEHEYGATIPPRAVIKLPALRYVRAVAGASVAVSGAGAEALVADVHDATVRAGTYQVNTADVDLTGASIIYLRALSAVTGEAHDTSVVDNQLGTPGICSGVVVSGSAQVKCP
jgi:hypothetical protein